MADDHPDMLPPTMRQLDFEVSVRRYDSGMESATQITPHWLCVLHLPTPMHVWQVPEIDGGGNVGRELFNVQLEEIMQVDPAWLAATITLSATNGARLAMARRVRMFIGDDHWGVDAYFRDFDGKTVWGVNIRRVPSPHDAGQPDPELPAAPAA